MKTRIYINPLFLTEENISRFRGMHLYDQKTRPYILLDHDDDIAPYADAVCGASFRDNPIMRTKRIQGEYSLGTAKGILTLSDDENQKRYHLDVTGATYEEVFCLLRAIRIGSILPDVSYDEPQMKNPAAVKLDKIKELLETFKPADPKQPVDQDNITFYNSVATLLKD